MFNTVVTVPENERVLVLKDGRFNDHSAPGQAHAVGPDPRRLEIVHRSP